MVRHFKLARAGDANVFFDFLRALPLVRWPHKYLLVRGTVFIAIFAYDRP